MLYSGIIAWNKKYMMAATAAAAGRVRAHATMMFPVTDQRTAESLLVAPTPRMEAVIVWVVEIGACNA